MKEEPSEPGGGGDPHESFFMFAQRRMCSSVKNMLAREGASRSERWGVEGGGGVLGTDSPSFSDTHVAACPRGFQYPRVVVALRCRRLDPGSAVHYILPSHQSSCLAHAIYGSLGIHVYVQPGIERSPQRSSRQRFPLHPPKKRGYYRILRAATFSLTLASVTAAVVASS